MSKYMLSPFDLRGSGLGCIMSILPGDQIIMANGWLIDASRMADGQ